MRNFREFPFRDCPKSPVGARGVALQIAKKALVDPFRPPHDVRIHLRSVAQTPFRTVSPRTKVNNRHRRVESPPCRTPITKNTRTTTTDMGGMAIPTEPWIPL